jgi:hypothetical protein
MSSLDHNLVCANSLTGIGSIEEALDVLVPDRKGLATLFDEPIEKALEAARTTLTDVAMLPEISKEQSRAASKAVQKARKDAEVAKLLFDAAVLRRIGREELVPGYDIAKISSGAKGEEAQEALAPLLPAHMPVMFPEVFLRDLGGFDVLIGNPPWEEVVPEELKFWTAQMPGLKAIEPGERVRQVEKMRLARPDLVTQYQRTVTAAASVRLVLVSGPYPGMGTGDPDLYKAFAWRNSQLISTNGRAGLVLPRSALMAKGSSEWRKAIVLGGSLREVTTLINAGNWVFAGVDGRYQIGLVVIGGSGEDFELFGPYRSVSELRSGMASGVKLKHSVIGRWGDGLEIPMFESSTAAHAYAQIQLAPSLEAHPSFNFSPMSEVSASLDKKRFFFAEDERPDDAPIVYGGRSFDLWEPDTGKYFGWARPMTIEDLHTKRLRQVRTKSSAFYGLDQAWASDPSTVPWRSARIAYRDISRATDSRTIRAALVPPGVIVNNTAPYLVRRSGSEADEAYMLGVMGSIPFDWAARQTIEMHASPYIVRSFPIPLPVTGSVTNRVVELAGRLAATDKRFSEWASAVGVLVGSVSEEEKPLLEAEIDALVSRLYGLSREHVIHIFETFHRGWDFQPRLTKVLEYFDKIEAPK